MYFQEVISLRCIASNIDHSCKGHDLRWVIWFIQDQEVHRLGSSAHGILEKGKRPQYQGPIF